MSERRLIAVSEEEVERPKVYAWCNSGWGTDWQAWIAMHEDGTVLGQHISSSRGFGESDIQPPLKAEQYDAHFCLGRPVERDDYELVVCAEGTGPPPEVVARNDAQREAALTHPDNPGGSDG